MELKDFIFFLSKPSTAYVDIEVDGNIKFNNYSYPPYTHLTDSDVVDIIDKLNLPGTKKDNTIHLTKDLLFKSVQLRSLLKINPSSDSLTINKESIQMSDSASVVDVTNRTGKDFVDKDGALLRIEAIPLLQKCIPYGDCDIDVYKKGDETIYHLYLPWAHVTWTHKDFDVEYPATAEIDKVLPDVGKLTCVKIKKTDLDKVLKEYDGIFPKYAWMYGQIEFDWNTAHPSIFGLRHETHGISYATTCPVELVSNTDGVDNHQFYLPTLCLRKYLTLTISEEITMDFNSLDPHDIHGGAVKVYSDDLNAAMAKLLVAK
jgi:hypothetical protein